MHAFVFRMIFLYQINGSQIKYRNVFCLKKEKSVLFWLVHFIFTEHVVIAKKMLLFYHFFAYKKRG